MSIEVLLIPLGIAAFAAVKESLSNDTSNAFIVTRITEQALLHESLEAIGASIQHTSPDQATATSPWGDLTFQQDGDLWYGRVDGADEERTLEMLNALDTEVGRIMQTRTAQLVVERAKSLGFRLVEQNEQDGSLNYVFEEI